MRQKTLMFIPSLLLGVLLLLLPQTTTHAANCDGLPTTGGVLAPGTYNLTDDCTPNIGFLIGPGVNVTINGNGHTINGGDNYRIFLNDGTLTLNNVTLTGGSASTSNPGGGAVKNNGGTLNVINSTFTGNSATTGGAILSKGNADVTIKGSTFANNSATFNGGGVFIENAAANLTIQNTTFSNNTAPGRAQSIAIYSSTATITNGTIANHAIMGTAIISTGNLTMTNTVIADNEGINCNLGGTFTDGGGNIEDGNSCGFSSANSSFPNTDPLLGAFNGSYFPLLQDSPAIDNAPDCAGLALDQRGVSRPQRSACDIGAIEVGAVPPSLNEWNATADESRAEAYGVADDIYAKVLMDEGEWVNQTGSVPGELIEYGVKLAVDIYRVDGGPSFDNYQKVCLQGEGRLIFLDATTSPRQQVEITDATLEDGYTCGWIPNAGTVVLIPDEPR